MFSGIVEEMGHIVGIDQQPGIVTLQISGSLCCEDLKIGDSISVNGICLTVCSLISDVFVVQAIPETINRTNLGSLKKGDIVNLERSITASTRIGGHFVQGHVDGTTTINKIDQEGDSLKVWFKRPQFYHECFIPKGYIALDGMSLTLVDVLPDEFSICLIPHTQISTIVKNYQVGTHVNLEIDHITKTVVHIIRSSHG